MEMKKSDRNKIHTRRNTNRINLKKKSGIDIMKSSDKIKCV